MLMLQLQAFKAQNLSGLLLPVSGRAECTPSPPLLAPRAVLHGDQETCAGSTQSGRQTQTQMAGLARPAGRVWDGAAQTPIPQVLSGSWVTFLGALSGGLFQGIDNLFQDVRAVISYLLENGVGELLQLCIVPFNFL